MLSLTLPFLKFAAASGAFAGATDAVQQYSRGLQFERNRRKSKANSWDADSTAKSALLGAVVGPLALVPVVQISEGLSGPNLVRSLIGLVTAEAVFLPLYQFSEKRVLSYKAVIPRVIVSSGLGTLVVCTVAAVPLGHLRQISNLGLVGTAFPESLIYTAGMSLCAFSLASFVHQNGLMMESSMSLDRQPLITQSRQLGYFSAANLMGAVLCDFNHYAFTHMLLFDLFIISTIGYQTWLTYIQSLEAEGQKQSQSEDRDEGSTTLNSTHPLRWRLNMATIGFYVLAGPFADSGNLLMSAVMKIISLAACSAYFETYSKEYEYYRHTFPIPLWDAVQDDSEDEALNSLANSLASRSAAKSGKKLLRAPYKTSNKTSVAVWDKKKEPKESPAKAWIPDTCTQARTQRTDSAEEQMSQEALSEEEEEVEKLTVRAHQKPKRGNSLTSTKNAHTHVDSEQASQDGDSMSTSTSTSHETVEVVEQKSPPSCSSD